MAILVDNTSHVTQGIKCILYHSTERKFLWACTWFPLEFALCIIYIISLRIKHAIAYDYIQCMCILLMNDQTSGWYWWLLNSRQEEMGTRVQVEVLAVGRIIVFYDNRKNSRLCRWRCWWMDRCDGNLELLFYLLQLSQWSRKVWSAKLENGEEELEVKGERKSCKQSSRKVESKIE